MTDLINKLRAVTGFIRFETGDRVAAAACLSEEAADRIEELEAALENISKPTYGLLDIQVNYGSDANAYNLHAMEYWRSLAQEYGRIACEALKGGE